MGLVGQKLKQVRLQKGVSLEEAHKKTKIHLNILKAIEEDQLVNLNPVYIKGFIKIYCKFLGVDFRDYISDYKEPKDISPAVSGLQKKPMSLAKRSPLGLFAFGISPRKIKIAAAVILIVIFTGAILFNLGKVISLKHKLLSLKPKPVVASVVKPEKKVEKIKIGGLNSAFVSLRLGIRAREDCWIQLKIDGKVIFQNILRKGRSENWQAKEKIELSLGNAGGVDLEVNGKVISNLGKRGQPLKNILINKEGLLVRR